MEIKELLGKVIQINFNSNQRKPIMILFLIFSIIIAVLGIVAVLIDRINFPQKAFKPKLIEKDMPEDYLGAHVTEIEDD